MTADADPVNTLIRNQSCPECGCQAQVEGQAVRTPPPDDDACRCHESWRFFCGGEHRRQQKAGQTGGAA